ncbi:MAG: methyltransferase domain-containing protein [Gemmatimonadetes bacterium]|nr:methyltransferase domain-containing protein [Gemmatimonadota bacterium]
MSLFVPPRAPASEAELLDVEPGRPDEIDDCLRELARVNRLLGGRRTTLAHLGPLLAATGKERVTVLDVAAGGGDMAEAMRDWALRRGLNLRFTFLDRHPVVLDFSRRAAGFRPHLVLGDALTLPFPDASFDLCVTSLFFHHLEPEEMEASMREMRRVARTGILVNDLVRDRLAWAWIVLLSRLFSRNRLVRHDGPLSVRRAYRPSDFRALAAGSGFSRWGVRRHFPYRMCLWGLVGDESRRGAMQTERGATLTEREARR